MAEAKKPADDLSGALTKRLKGLPKDQIKSLADLIAGLKNVGLDVDDAFPLGVVVQDGVMVRGNLAPDKTDILNKVIGMHPGITEVRVFPRGIIAPERLRVHIGVRP